MSELEKAKQEVEQVCFAYNKAGDTGDIKDWKCFYDLEDKLIEKVKIVNQPSLTIPKSIADEIDCVVNPIGQIVLKSGILSDFTVEAISWIYKNNENGYIAIAYANPLTRNLVKVVEG